MKKIKACVTVSMFVYADHWVLLNDYTQSGPYLAGWQLPPKATPIVPIPAGDSIIYHHRTSDCSKWALFPVALWVSLDMQNMSAPHIKTARYGPDNRQVESELLSQIQFRLATYTFVTASTLGLFNAPYVTSVVDNPGVKACLHFLLSYMWLII